MTWVGAWVVVAKMAWVGVGVAWVVVAKRAGGVAKTAGVGVAKRAWFGLENKM